MATTNKSKSIGWWNRNKHIATPLAGLVGAAFAGATWFISSREDLGLKAETPQPPPSPTIIVNASPTIAPPTTSSEPVETEVVQTQTAIRLSAAPNSTTDHAAIASPLTPQQDSRESLAATKEDQLPLGSCELSEEQAEKIIELIEKQIITVDQSAKLGCIISQKIKRNTIKRISDTRNIDQYQFIFDGINNEIQELSQSNDEKIRKRLVEVLKAETPGFGFMANVSIKGDTSIYMLRPEDAPEIRNLRALIRMAESPRELYGSASGSQSCAENKIGSISGPRC